MKTKGSLGGQNSLGRKSGARSSRALSIFKKLQSLDMDITRLDTMIYGGKLWGQDNQALIYRRKRQDETRKEIRSIRKKFPFD